jgi:hypothetical protein
MAAADEVLLPNAHEAAHEAAHQACLNAPESIHVSAPKVLTQTCTH